MYVLDLKKKLVSLVVTVCLGGFLLSGCAPQGLQAVPSPTLPTITPGSDEQFATPIASEKPTSDIEGDPNSPATDDQTPVEPGATAIVDFINTGFDSASNTISVVAMVSNVISSTGECVLSVSQGAEAYSARVEGTADAQVTYCANMNVSLPSGASGEWKILVEFSDGKYSGSAITKISV